MIIEATKSSSKIIYSTARNWDHVSDRCSDITKSNEVSIRHVKRELFEKATEEIIKHFTEKLTKEYIVVLTKKKE